MSFLDTPLSSSRGLSRHEALRLSDVGADRGQVLVVFRSRDVDRSQTDRGYTGAICERTAHLLAHVLRELIGGDRMVRVGKEHTSELQSPDHLVCRLLLEKNKCDAR